MRTFRKLIVVAALGLLGLALLTGCGGATTPTAPPVQST